MLASSSLSCTTKAIYTLIGRRPPDAEAFAFAPAPAGPDPVYSLGVYSMVDPRNPVLIARTLRDHARLLELCAQHGGRPYLYGAHTLTEQIMHRCFDPDDLERLETLRRTSELDTVSTGSRRRHRPS